MKKIKFKEINDNAYDGFTMRRFHEEPIEHLLVDPEKAWDIVKPCLNIELPKGKAIFTSTVSKGDKVNFKDIWKKSDPGSLVTGI